MHNYMKTILSAVKTWANGRIKDSVADWNQNDSSADNYIKNRPFYEKDGVIHTIDSKYLPEEYATVNDIDIIRDAVDVAQDTADIAITNAATAQSTAEAAQTSAETAQTTADGKMNAKNPVGSGSFSINRKTNSVIGTYSHAEGYNTTASGTYSHAEGSNTIAAQACMSVEGRYNLPCWDYYVSKSTSAGSGAVSFGYRISGFNFNSDKGYFEITNVETSQSNYKTVNFGAYYVERYSTTDDNVMYTQKIYRIVSKEKKNDMYHLTCDVYMCESSSYGKYVRIIGNGVSGDERSNAHTLDWDGNAWFAGDVYVGSSSETNKDEGSVKLAKVSDIPVNDKYVIDFGLPVKIDTSDFDVLDRVLASGTAAYGTITIAEDGKSFVYTPTSILMGIDSVVLTFSDDSTHTVSIVPAPVMHYDEHFLTYEDAKTTTTDADGNTIVATDENGNVIYVTGDIGTWSTDGTRDETLMQNTHIAGKCNDVYGFDDVFKSYSKYSTGSAKCITVNTDTGSFIARPVAKFTFSGTGFDIIAPCDNFSGWITVDVKDMEGNYALDVNGNHASSSSWLTSTHSYDETTNSWVKGNSQDNLLPQCSVIRAKNLPYNTYDVAIYAGYAGYYDLFKNGYFVYYIDAIRIYGTVSEDENAKNIYALDCEDSFSYNDVSKLSATSWSDTSGTATSIITVKKENDSYTLVSSANDSTMYKNRFGSGMVKAFQINVTGNNPKVQLGIKTDYTYSGTDTHASFIDSFDASSGLTHYTTKVISTPTEMFYEVPIIKYNEKSYVIVKHTGKSNFICIETAKLADCEIVTQADQTALDEFVADIIKIANGTNGVQIDTALDETSFNAVQNKVITSAINQLSEEIAKGPSVEDIVGLDTTLTEEGKAADAKAVGDAMANFTKPYMMQNIGVLYDNPEGYDYVAWCPGNLRYDSINDRYVSLVYASTRHVNGTTALFVSYIDPKTYEATAPVQCFTDDGATALSGSTAFWIDDDGIYKMLYKYTDNTTYLFTSTDGGVNWTKGDAVSGFSGSPWGITKLSNGRLIFGDDATKVGIYYSDNGGINWTQVIPATSGGNYEAEACILELEQGKLIAIARYSMSGIGYSASGDSEPALVSYSDDYGATWTAWKKSETITNMNASTCAGIVHNGMVDIFAASRWYWHGSYSNTDYDNTGKTGAITHYTATIENALADNFTNNGILTYAKATGDSSSQDFHSPALAARGDEILLMWFDRIYPYSEEITSHYFARGAVGTISCVPNDELESAVFPYSSAKVQALLRQQYNKLITKLNEAIVSGDIVDTEGEGDGEAYVGTYIFDGVVMNLDFVDESKYDTTNMTLTDSINGVVGTFVTTQNGMESVSTAPEIRDNSVAVSHLKFPANTLSQFLSDPYEISFELTYYKYDGDTIGTMYHVGSLPMCSDGGGGSSLRLSSNGISTWYINTEGSTVGTQEIGNPTVIKGHGGASDTNVLLHAVWTLGSDGTVSMYSNGELLVSKVVHSTFAQWAPVNLTRAFSFYGPLKSARIYNRVLTADEVLNNYNYELNSIV